MDTYVRLLDACGVAIELDAAPGSGVDLTQIRERLRLTPDERLDLLARSANNLAGFLGSRP